MAPVPLFRMESRSAVTGGARKGEPMRSSFALAACALTAASSWTVAQEPMGRRGPVVINEVVPNPEEGRAPWVELAIRTRDADLAGLVLRTGAGLEYRVPESAVRDLENVRETLRGDGGELAFLVVALAPTGPEGELTGYPGRDDPPSVMSLDLVGDEVADRLRSAAVRARGDAFAAWTPRHGELLLARETAGGQRQVLDYAAWGRAGRDWSRGDRVRLWPGSAFVPLAEGFGLYDPDTALDPGASIGLYPGADTSLPDDWVVYDPDETTKGRRNAVPRPKAFTVPDGAVVGANSVAIGWAPRKGDDGYRVVVSRRLGDGAQGLEEVVNLPVTGTAFRMADSLSPASYLVTVKAISNHDESAKSRSLSLEVRDTGCDWPALPPTPGAITDMTLDQWLSASACLGKSDCKLLSEIKFKFQRKDSNLLCVSDRANSRCSLESERCPWDAPNEYCVAIFFMNPHPAVRRLCAGLKLSPPCDVVPQQAGSVVESVAAAVQHLVAIAVPGSGAAVQAVVQSVKPIRLCPHGWNYCGMASLSMVSSAYGGCLSQDRIAYQLCQRNTAEPWGELCHGEGVTTSEMDSLFKWAMGLTGGQFSVNPARCRFVNVAPPLPGFTAARFDATNPPEIDFDTVRCWIDNDRPVIGLGGLHYTVLAGYCRDEHGGEWVYEYDPKNGPKVVSFQTWQGSNVTAPLPGATQVTRAVWVGPATGTWTKTVSDEPGMWSDQDGDGLTDFDEARFGTSPTDADSDDLGGSDKEDLAAAATPWFLLP